MFEFDQILSGPRISTVYDRDVYTPGRNEDYRHIYRSGQKKGDMMHISFEHSDYIKVRIDIKQYNNVYGESVKYVVINQVPLLLAPHVINRSLKVGPCFIAIGDIIVYNGDRYIVEDLHETMVYLETELELLGV